ncbi:MAG: AbrB/MazE/SpoVT family DNA-binding domain-containing protein [Oscillospiraceae bacterium]
MKSTGIIRKVDEVGRLVLPIETRRVLGLEEGSGIEIFVDNDSIVLKKFENSCVFCQSSENLNLYKGKYICDKCLDELKK